MSSHTHRFFAYTDKDKNKNKKDKTEAPSTTVPTVAPPTTTTPTGSPTQLPTTTAPQQQPTRLPTTQQPTQQPTVNATENPTLSPTYNPTNQPTFHPTNATAAPSQQQLLVDASVVLELNDETKEQLESIQITVAGDEPTIALSFSLWLPDRIGVEDTEEASMSASVQSSLIAALHYLFCVQGKQVDLEAWGLDTELENWNEKYICAVHESIMEGDGVVSYHDGEMALSLTGGRQRLRRQLKRAEIHMFDEKDIEKEMADFEAMQKQKENKGGKEDRLDQGGPQNMGTPSGNGEKVPNVEKEIPNGDEMQKEKEKDKAKDRQDNGGKQNIEKNSKNVSIKKNANENDNVNKNKEDGNEQVPVMEDPSIVMHPPQLLPKVHMHANHHNKAWTTWTVTWPVIRLSMNYLETAWLVKAEMKEEGVTDKEIFALGTQLFGEEMESYLNDNINLKVLDVLLADLLDEPVMASMVGSELDTFQDSHLISEGNEHHGMHPVEVEGVDADPLHPLRIAGIIMFLVTLKVILMLAYLSRRRKKAREEEWKRLNIGEGMLHSPDGVDEMLQKTGNTMVVNVNVVPANKSIRSIDDTDDHSSSDDERKIPLPATMQLQPTPNRATF